MKITRLVRVTSIRSDNPLGRGGCIFYGTAIDDGGVVLDARETYVVVASSHLLAGGPVQVGQWWRVTGGVQARPRVINGYRILEQQIEAEELELALPSGEHLITMLSEGEDFVGVGTAKARRLWEAFGERLYEVLDTGDVAALSTVRSVSPEIAQRLVNGWRVYGDTRTLQWLHQRGFGVALGRKVLAHFGTEVTAAIEEDPYRLLSFCANWAITDRFAREHFGVAEGDSRRLQGAIEESLYRLFADGHTAVSRQMVITRLASVLGTISGESSWRTLATAALASGRQNGSYVVGPDNRIHQLGAYVMETTVANALAGRITDDDVSARLLDVPSVDQIIGTYESEERLTLNNEQKAAIHVAAAGRLAIITGGAGVGKTTVLKALYRVYDKAGVRVLQAALAGRAAKRMQEATNRPGQTLAGLLKNTKEQDFEGACVVVVDEASMVDIVSMYRLCTLLPPHVRLLLAGDPFQLMPVGPGLVLHALENQPSIPSVELKVVKRYGGAIATAASSIRDGVWPQLPEDATAAIAFVSRPLRTVGSAGESSFPIASTVLELYRQAPDDTQILSPRKNGADGVKALNELCQAHLTADAEPLTIWSDEFECRIDTRLRMGDPVVCTRNLWDIGLQNGSLGRIVQIERESRELVGDTGSTRDRVIAWIAWDDGERRPVTEALLDDLELAYALTVHKAQGSQWRRIIVPITGNRLLDRTLIYTAITRAQAQVILVGDKDAARRAVEAPPRANRRNTALSSLLRTALEQQQVAA
jgi:exodeoxyribonuclease V alpha subunit